MKSALGNVSAGEQSTAPSHRSRSLRRTLQERRERFKSCGTLHLPGETSHSLQETALCSPCSSAERVKIARAQSGKSTPREGIGKGSSLSAAACATSRVEAEATAALHAKADPSNCYCRLIFQNTITTSLPTLFKACTGMWEASMSFRSLSASYLRSLETLNLQSKMWVWLSAEETVGARTVINSSD